MSLDSFIFDSYLGMLLVSLSLIQAVVVHYSSFKKHLISVGLVAARDP